MSQRSSRIFLEDIIQSADKIRRYTKGLEYDDFVRNEMVTDAVLRNLEIIGEAAGNIPDDIRSRYPHIPWRRIVGLRNIVIHAYFNVDLNIIWQIVTVNLPEIRHDIGSVLEDI